jgi:hypothetical protein
MARSHLSRGNVCGSAIPLAVQWGQMRLHATPLLQSVERGLQTLFLRLVREIT